MLSNTEIRAHARKSIKGNIPKLFLPELFVIGIIVAAGLLSKLNEGLSVISSLIDVIFSVGLASICLSAVRGSYIQFSDVFCGFDQLVRVILTNLYANLWIFLKMLLLIIPGIIVAYALALIPYIRADDPDIGVREACDRSRWLMEGRKGDMFFLELSFLPWILLSVVTLGIGLIYVIPYYSTAIAAFYDSIIEDEKTRIAISNTPADAESAEETDGSASDI